jgi:hypothetical protein
VLNYKLYSAFRNQLISGIAFLLSLTSFFIPVFIQSGQPFNLQLFFFKMILMTISAVFFFYFLRNLFCPVIQIYQTEVIVSKFVRVSVPTDRIKEFVLKNGRARLLYVEGQNLKEIVVSFRQPDEMESNLT